jgi:hypothetical protein
MMFAAKGYHPATASMQTLWMMFLAALLMTAVGYAQFLIPRYTAGTARVALARGVLIVVGIGLGVVSAALYAEPGLAILAFIIGFGAVHFPAALILLIKRARGAGKT